jgi:hypothetical protein
MPVTGRPPEPMKIEHDAESSAVIAKYAELKGHTPDEYRIRAEAERVVAWRENRVTRSLMANCFRCRNLCRSQNRTFLD